MIVFTSDVHSVCCVCVCAWFQMNWGFMIAPHLTVWRWWWLDQCGKHFYLSVWIFKNFHSHKASHPMHQKTVVLKNRFHRTSVKQVSTSLCGVGQQSVALVYLDERACSGRLRTYKLFHACASLLHKILSFRVLNILCRPSKDRALHVYTWWWCKPGLSRDCHMDQ